MNTERNQLPAIRIKDFLLILLGSFLYAVSTLLFIFPHSLLLGGTSGISVILEAFLPFSPGSILMVMNSLLIILAFLILGKEMGNPVCFVILLEHYCLGEFKCGKLLAHPNVLLHILNGNGGYVVGKTFEEFVCLKDYFS